MERWQWRIFAITWMAYAGYYLCRKAFSVAMPLLAASEGLSTQQLASAVFAFSFAYAAAQFLVGPLSDLYGPRRLVAGGMALSAAATLATGFAAAPAAFAVLEFLNGIGQACGWSGLVKVMAAWFHYRRRGTVMGWWATNSSLGGFLATVFATFAATNLLFYPSLGWRRGFFAPGIVLAALVFVFRWLVRNQPPDVGLPAVEDPPDAVHFVGKPSILKVFGNRSIQITALAYFFLKMTRYAMLFWLPLYMTQRLHLTAGDAGYRSAVFEFAGCGGSMLAGWLSDRAFSSRRAPVASLMMLGLAAICLAFPFLSGWGWLGSVAAVARAGICTYGPDTLLTGAAPQDAGSQHGAASAAGYVNGIGSLGMLLSPWIVALVVGTWGWDRLFLLFAAFAVLGAAILSANWGGHRLPGMHNSVART